MDIGIRRTNLLILKGIFPKDFSALDTVFVGKEVKKSTDESRPDGAVYSRIPKRFTDVTSWSRLLSNLKCWSCDLLFQVYPKFVPLNPERDKDGNDTCDVYGNFCNWNCVAFYVVREFPKEQQWDILQTICIFESKFTGRRREKIMPSPSKTERKEYCGEDGLTNKQYQEKIDQLNADYDLSIYRLDHFKRGE